MSPAERCIMASELPPDQWSEELLYPLHKLPVSIFGYQQTAMCRDNSVKLIEAMIWTELATSLGDARKAIKNNGVRINGKIRVTDTELVLTKEHVLPNIDAIVLERGKYNFGIIELC